MAINAQTWPSKNNIRQKTLKGVEATFWNLYHRMLTWWWLVLSPAGAAWCWCRGLTWKTEIWQGRTSPSCWEWGVHHRGPPYSHCSSLRHCCSGSEHARHHLHRPQRMDLSLGHMIPVCWRGVVFLLVWKWVRWKENNLTVNECWAWTWHGIHSHRWHTSRGLGWCERGKQLCVLKAMLPTQVNKENQQKESTDL